MKTAYISHNDCLAHEPSQGHPEHARRLEAIQKRLSETGLFQQLHHVEAPVADQTKILAVHDSDYLSQLNKQWPDEGTVQMDPDTFLSKGTQQAALRAAGAGVKAVDLVLSGDYDNAFCAIRPPGHHALRAQAMGFCIFNNIAIAAAHAMQTHGLDRIAILDFDIHQGNGTAEIFLEEPRVLFCSIFQHPFYPNSPIYTDSPNMASVPLEAGAGSTEFRQAITEHWLPALHAFKPEMIFISAGFDAHKDDLVANVSLTEDDFHWVSGEILAVAKRHCKGRIVSMLEGGYEPESLARSVEQHLRVLSAQD